MIKNLFDLSGKRALVTGAAQGIGNTLARGLAQCGAAIILSDIDQKKLSTAHTELHSYASEIHSLNFNVTDYAATKKAIDSFELNHGSIDILINNAGVQYRSELHEFPNDEFQKLLDTNIAGAFYVSKVIAPYMIARGYGKIINIASVQSALARPGIAPYTATKGAIMNLTKGMATDWAKYGLQCNAIAPGYLKTPLNKDLVSNPEFSDWLVNRTPAGRWGEVEDLIGVCIFLSSNAANFVNGQTIFVDGGISVSL